MNSEDTVRARGVRECSAMIRLASPWGKKGGEEKHSIIGACIRHV